MELEQAKDKAREYIKDLAKTKREYNDMISGMLILEDAINGEL